jgi:hypothetical protein
MCTVRDECGPIRIGAGSKGYNGKGSLVVTFSDDTHFTGTIRFDVGHSCVMDLEVTANHLL